MNLHRIRYNGRLALIERWIVWTRWRFAISPLYLWFIYFLSNLWYFNACVICSSLSKAKPNFIILFSSLVSIVKMAHFINPFESFFFGSFGCFVDTSILSNTSSARQLARFPRLRIYILYIYYMVFFLDFMYVSFVYVDVGKRKVLTTL